MKDAADFRKMAREALRDKWLPAILVGFLAALLGGANINAFEFEFQRTVDSANIGVDFGGIRLYSTSISQVQRPMIDTFLASALVTLLIVAVTLFVIQLILGSIVAVGYSRFNLNLIEGGELSLKTLFAYFPQWKTMVAARLLQIIYILGWTLLFIIPGIIAGYRYALTEYILAENPEMTATEAINLSKELMDGNKWRLFCLSFSFIGWDLLCILTLGIGNLWLGPYKQAATAAFYLDVIEPMADTESEEETEEPEE